MSHAARQDIHDAPLCPVSRRYFLEHVIQALYLHLSHVTGARLPFVNVSQQTAHSNEISAILKKSLFSL